MRLAMRIRALAGRCVRPADRAAVAATAAPGVADAAQTTAPEHVVRLVEPNGPHLRVVPSHAEDATA